MSDPLIQNIGVIGMGHFGTAIGHWLAHHFNVIGWTRSQDTADEINHQHTNGAYLPNYNLHPNLRASTQILEVISNVQALFICLHARYIPELILQTLGKVPPRCIVVNTSKGLLLDSGQTVYDYLAQAFGGHSEVLHLAGPLAANEFARGANSVAILSRPHTHSRDTIALLFYGTPISVTFSTDIQGLLWGSIVKNIYTIGFGLIEVIAKNNINLQGIYITKAYEEMLRFVQDKGGYAETVGGLSVLGDFMATSLSTHSQNHRYGTQLANKILHKEPLDLSTGPEGIFALKSLAGTEDGHLARYPIMYGLWQLMNGQLEVTDWTKRLVDSVLGADKSSVNFG